MVWTMTATRPRWNEPVVKKMFCINVECSRVAKKWTGKGGTSKSIVTHCWAYSQPNTICAAVFFDGPWVDPRLQRGSSFMWQGVVLLY